MKRLLILLTTYIVLLFLVEEVLINDDLIYASLISRQLPIDSITEVISASKKWKFIVYGFLPFLISMKVFLVSTCLFVGAFLINNNTELKSFVRLSIVAEFIHLLPVLVKLIWFTLINNSYTLKDIQDFQPLSAFSIINPDEIDAWGTYPIKLLNLFELSYWCILAWQLKDLLNRDFIGSLGFVASTYGVGLLLWVIFVMFLSASLT
jgi:hypothetical protein